MAGNASHVGAVELFEGICVSVRCRGDKGALVGRSISVFILYIGGRSRDAQALFGDVRCIHAAFIGMVPSFDKGVERSDRAEMVAPGLGVDWKGHPSG